MPLPPPPAARPALEPDLDARRSRRLDVALVGLTLVLAFLLASFPARNSDVWAHLAAGRALARDGFAFGTDPFLYSTAGQTWVNHSWLYDLLCYGIFQLLGGPALVLGKALLVVLTAEFLLRTGRAGRGLWASAVCTALALLTMGPHLQLQPVCVSYLFLALTVWFLERQRRAAAPPGFASYWPLLVLFALWVNLDAWFFLGPLTVALYGLGELLRPRAASAEPHRQARTLGLVLLAGLASCLLNPYHVRVFGVLPLLAPDSLLAAFSARPGLLLLPANLAYLGLVVLGAVSFARVGLSGRGGRAALWLGFLLLSAYQVRAMPFFAIVAAPVLALNLQDLAARRAAASRADRVYRRSLAGRWLTVAVGVLLLAAVWQGLVQRRALPLQRWSVEPDPALVRVADQLAHWRRQGKLPADGNGFNFSPEVGNYFAWAAPEKAFADGRLADFPAVAKESADVRKGVEQELRRRAERKLPEQIRADVVAALVQQLRWAEQESGEPEGEAWREILRRHKVNHVVLYDTDFVRLSGLLGYFFTTPREWPLLYLDGHVAVFGWRDSQRAGGPGPFAGLRLDLGAAAYHPPADKKAPPRGPGRPPEVRPWWDLLRPPPPPRPLAADEAAMYTLCFDAVAQRQTLRNTFTWLSYLPAGLAGLSDPRAGSPAGPLAWFAQQGVAHTLLHFPGSPREGERPGTVDRLAAALHAGYLQTQDSAPLELPLLAVRAARRAISENPDDVGSYIVLAEAYLRLATGTRERAWGKDLRQLRDVQLITALHSALEASRNDLQAAKVHEQLWLLSLGMKYHDVSLKHRREQLRHTRAAGPQGRETARQFEQRVAALARDVADFEKVLADRLADYEANAVSLRPNDRAQLAFRNGLAGKALEILLASDISAFGAEGAQVQLELMLKTGRAHDVRAWLDDDLKQRLGARAYYWLRVQAAAALGDYAEADRELQAAQKAETEVPRGEKATVPTLAELGFVVGGMVLEGLTEDSRTAWRLPPPGGRQLAMEQLVFLVQSFQRGADIGVLRGLLALESGETDRAERHFRQALACWGAGGRRAPSGLDFPWRPVAQECLALIERSARKDRK